MNAIFGFFSLVIVISTRYFLIPRIVGFDLNTNLLQYLDVLFNTPFISYKTLKECIFMLNYKGDITQGSNLNQLPLYVKFFSLIPENLHFYVFCLFDLGSIYFIVKIINKKNEKEINQNNNVKIMLYLLNPLTYINLLMKTEFVVIQFCLIAAIYYIQKTKNSIDTIKSAFFIAIATYLDIYNIGLSLILINFTSKNKQLFIVSFVSIQALLMAISYKMQPSFIINNIFSKALFKEQYPNIGLWWYFFIEMFEEYRDFFKFVFNCYCYIFVLPMFIRFKKYPLQAFVILFTWITLFKPYPSIGELGLILLFFVYWFDLKIIENKLIMTLLVIHSLVLLPVFYHLWITIGSGNSNFFYALTLVYVLSLVLILLGMVKSVLYWEYKDTYIAPLNDKEDKEEEQIKLTCVQ